MFATKTSPVFKTFLIKIHHANLHQKIDCHVIVNRQSIIRPKNKYSVLGKNINKHIWFGNTISQERCGFSANRYIKSQCIKKYRSKYCFQHAGLAYTKQRVINGTEITTAKQFNQETYSFFYVNIYKPDQQTYQHFHEKSRFQEKKTEEWLKTSHWKI